MILLVFLAGCSASFERGISSASRTLARSIVEEMPYYDGYGTESYEHHEDNRFRTARAHPLSTFAVDVDSASYANVRRFLHRGQMPPRDAVRIEELINYFPYSYEPTRDDHPLAIHVEAASCPWDPSHRLVRIGLKGREVKWRRRPASNLVFLLDVSGSMGTPHKLPLLKRALRMLASKLDGDDRVAIVVYAGAAGLVLPSTRGDKRPRIRHAIERLHAGGWTNGGAGLALAYRVARENFIAGGVNRVILATDGDFNVGVTGRGELTRLIGKNPRSGVSLTVLGFGMGNYKDDRLERLAGRGHGNYAYIDSMKEARKVLIEQVSGTLVTIARDVKIQVEFNPARVHSYRLIGYEDRILRARDFNDDRKDAGDIGAGHTVTALYEIVPAGGRPGIDPLKYEGEAAPPPPGIRAETLTVKLRYKRPDGATSQRLELPFADHGASLSDATSDFKFAAAIAAWGMLLRGSEHRGNANYGLVRALAQQGRGRDRGGYRRDFLELLDTAHDPGCE